MAEIVDITTGDQTVTATGAVTGVLDTATFTGDYTVKVRIFGLEDGKSAVIALQDTASGTPFNDAIDVAVFHVKGKVTAEADIVLNKKSYEIPGTRYGVTNSKLRFNVRSLTSDSNLKIRGWLER